MLLSGIGDLVSNLTAISDWKLAFHEAHEPVNDFAVLIARSAAENLLRFPEQKPQSEAFTAMLAGALVMSGVAMEIAGTSRPASGSEHLISHAYDGLATRPSLHGIQVGVATLAIAWLQGLYYEEIQRVLQETGFCDWVRRHPLEREAFLAAVAAAPGIKEGFHTVLSDRERRSRLLAFLREDGEMAAFLA
jgi:glycerol-1-phosphate dehydrogenase [NAD(P)+]